MGLEMIKISTRPCRKRDKSIAADELYFAYQDRPQYKQEQYISFAVDELYLTATEEKNCDIMRERGAKRRDRVARFTRC